MRRELSPLDTYLLDDDNASIFNIGRCENGTIIYSYSVRKWNNGKTGAIVDLYEITDDVDNEGNSLFEKEEGRNLGHSDFLFFVSSEIDLVKISESYPGLTELWSQCPIVAEGIIARFVKVYIIDRNYPEMFKAYYEMEMKLYARDCQRRDPFSFNVNLEDKFANGVHLHQEKKKIEYSLKHLLPYIKEDQHAQIKRVAEAYLKYVESRSNKKENINISRKRNSRKAGKKAFDPDKCRETFTYWPDGMSKQERDIRLKIAFSRMKGTLIDSDTHYDTFESLLSGKPLDVKIVWIGINSQLRELFSQLVTKKKLLKKPTGGLNQILTARFKKADGTLFTPNEIKNAGRDGDMSSINDVVKFLTPSPVEMEDLETQLHSLLTEEQERAELKGKKDNKHQEHLPNGTNISSRPNQRTRRY